MSISMFRAMKSFWFYFHVFLFKIFLFVLHALFIVYKSLLSFEVLFRDVYTICYYKIWQKCLKKELIIIGGGYAGTYAAMKLERHFNVTMLDTKEYFEFTPSRLRTIVNPEKAKAIQVEHKKVLKRSHICIEKVQQVFSEAVITESSTIPFDFLIICTGARYSELNLGPMFFIETNDEKPNANHSFDRATNEEMAKEMNEIAPLVENGEETISERSLSRDLSRTSIGHPSIEARPILEEYDRFRLLISCPSSSAVILSARVAHFERYHEVMLSSRRILIVGGGTVGVELAAEIVENFPEKELVLVNSQPQLINRCSPKAIRYVENFLRRNGVRLVLNERVVAHQGIMFMTHRGTMIEAELVFICTGNVPNSEFLKESCHFMPNSNVNRFGFVRVNEFLQLPQYENVFVAGDITDIPGEEEKLCQTAAAEIKVVVRNIFNIQGGKPLVKYVPSKCPLVISLGKYDGLFTYRGWTITGFLPALMKEFIEWKEMIYYWNWDRLLPMKSFLSLCTFSTSIYPPQEESQKHSHFV